MGSEDFFLSNPGHFLCDKICLEELNMSSDLAEVLMEGLAALTRQEEVRIY